jgi:hypothetical protein
MNCAKDLQKNKINIWRNEVEKDFYIMGVNSRHIKARSRRKWGRFYLKLRYRMDCSTLEGDEEEKRNCRRRYRRSRRKKEESLWEDKRRRGERKNED